MLASQHSGSAAQNKPPPGWRVGVPRGVKGLSSILGDPALSTAYGLALFASLPYREDIPQPMLPCRPPKKRGRFARGLRKLLGFMV